MTVYSDLWGLISWNVVLVWENWPAPTAAVAHLPTPADHVRGWWRKARRVYPEATLRAWHFDRATIIAFCKSRRLLPLPASPATVAAFIESCGEADKKPGHRPPLSGNHRLRASRRELLNSNDDEDVKLALKGTLEDDGNADAVWRRHSGGIGWHGAHGKSAGAREVTVLDIASKPTFGSTGWHESSRKSFAHGYLAKILRDFTFLCWKLTRPGLSDSGRVLPAWIDSG